MNVIIKLKRGSKYRSVCTRIIQKAKSSNILFYRNKLCQTNIFLHSTYLFVFVNIPNNQFIFHFNSSTVVKVNNNT